MAEGDNLPSPVNSPQRASRFFRLAGTTIASQTLLALDAMVVPFDCYVRSIQISNLKQSSGYLTVVNVATTDAAKTIFNKTDFGDASTTAKYALNADVLNDAYPIDKGDVITLKYTSGSNCINTLSVILELVPRWEVDKARI